MMRKLSMTGIAMLMLAISSCDEDTASIGNSLTSSTDKFEIVSDTFPVTSRSIVAGAVLSRSDNCYLGRIKDPETGAYITSDYMTQFTILEKESNTLFASKDKISSLNEAGEVIADSCHINIIVDKWQGDSLATMKLTAYELGKPYNENNIYYTDFDPIANGYVEENGFRQNKIYSIVDMQQNDSVRSERASSSYYDYINIPLNNKYVDANGKEYNNYGSYLLNNYYDHPEYFSNSYNFRHNLCKGFFFKIVDGLGEMSQVSSTQLIVYYRFKIDGKEYVGDKVFNATQEVMQTTHITNDHNIIEKLANDNSCTYLKSPAGIYTEVTLPIDDIKAEHENDTITSAKIVFQRMNYNNAASDEVLTEPTNLLMVPADSVHTFFEHNNLPNNITSYIASYNSTYNTYTFNNISGLINYLYDQKLRGIAAEDRWNKVVLIPVSTVTTTISSASTIASVSNEMNLTSVRLVGGSNNTHEPITISVVYNKTSR